MNDTSRWLESLGPGMFAKAFAENDVDLRVLPELTEDDLKELGVSLGHRRNLQRAMRTRDAERRQLTVMFSDLVGLVGLGEQIDVED